MRKKVEYPKYFGSSEIWTQNRSHRHMHKKVDYSEYTNGLKSWIQNLCGDMLATSRDKNVSDTYLITRPTEAVYWQDQKLSFLISNEVDAKQTSFEVQTVETSTTAWTE